MGLHAGDRNPRAVLRTKNGGFMESRRTAVAGRFYPDDPALLRRDLDRYLAQAEPPPPDLGTGAIRALVVPHAGYVYSGPIAGSAYALLRERRGDISRVLLLGPSHYVAFEGMALSSADAFDTPLGPLAVDRELAEAARRQPQVQEIDVAHAREHSLEVQLPFIARTLPSLPVLPVVVGDCPPASVAELLDTLCQDASTLIVISTDLSHFLDYDSAVTVDAATTSRIEALTPDLRPEEACGCRPLNGLLALAAARRYCCVTLDVRNSGDTAGSRERVVGYGAYALQ